VRDEVAKANLLSTWLARYGNARARLASAGAPIQPRAALESIRTIVDASSSDESLYVLVAEEDEPVPLYVGRAALPVRRWQSHLAGLQRGTGSYARWRDAILDAEGNARVDLVLILVSASSITEAPIPGFPCSVGAVEYQLVSLAGDAYGRLLNVEGNRR
jgi:hypothetical protein